MSGPFFDDFARSNEPIGAEWQQASDGRISNQWCDTRDGMDALTVTIPEPYLSETVSAYFPRGGRTPPHVDVTLPDGAQEKWRLVLRTSTELYDIYDIVP